MRKPAATKRRPPAANVPVIHPRSVYTRETLTAALGLPKNTVRREIREGRLRASRRAGWYFILGEWVLEWFRGGEVERHRHRMGVAGRNGDGAA
jgi:hypothetical protein